jgi:uncharacterized membrane protein YesL
MGSIFNMDNGLFSAIGKIVDIILLSVVWLVLCIPIITIGPATTALYYVTVKVIRRERGYLMREFFRSFKENFKNGVISGVILTVIILVLTFNRSFALNLKGTTGFMLLSAYNAMLFLIFCIIVYIFPVLSRFRMSVKQLFKTSFFMSMKHLPTTLLLVVIVAFFGFATYILQILIFISPAICYLLCSFLLERVFKKYMPEKSLDAEISGRDEWYLE